MIAGEYPVLALAFLGDAALELRVRSKLLASGAKKLKELNVAKVAAVNAAAQARAAKGMMDVFTLEELAVFKRGRNAKGSSAPKNAELADYKAATGLEAVFGYLLIVGDTKREAELFDIFWETLH